MLSTQLTISAVSDSKTYDGTKASTATPTVQGLVAGDTLTAIEAYASKDVLGTNGSTMVVSGYTINDTSGTSYVVTTVAGTGTIISAALTITATANTKVYNGTTSALATPTAGALLGTDTVTATKEAYASKDVLGTNGSTLIVSGYTINDGNNGHDYTVTTATRTGTITAAALTITAAANTKVYNGTTSATAIPTVSGLAGGRQCDGFERSL